jgi:diguanylate cyclase (GGDEF)-like protein
VGELRARHIDGSSRTVEMFANNRLADSAVRGIILNSRDITERKYAEALLEKQAFHDTLTGLPNRALLNNRLNLVLCRAQREHTSFSLCVLDLDHFKDVNDRLGHWCGDLLLQEVAVRLLRTLRASDTVARLGGDEFAMLLPRTQSADAIAAARRSLDSLAEPWSVQNQRIDISGSIGIATFPEHGNDASDLLAHADVDMYSAKNAGTGYAVYDDALERNEPRWIAPFERP